MSGRGHSSTVLVHRPLTASSPYLKAALKSVWDAVVAGAGGRDDTLSRDQFIAFLMQTQQESEADARATAEKITAAGKVEFGDFVTYMCSPTGNALRLPQVEKRDMSHPLTSYFISSSHNTYLVGHQLYGDSTTAGYINVLRRGCRCIEIDVWDGDDDEPEVFHGYTLTKEISFKEVCKAIGEHAFWSEGGEVVDGPVIISLECHCGPVQQERMVQIMKDVWGDKLVQQPFCGAKTIHDVDRVPTLDELRGKILVKTKYHPPDPAKDPVAAVAAATSNLSLSRPGTGVSTQSKSSSDSSGDDELRQLAQQSNQQPPPKKSKIIRALSDLAIYMGAQHFPGTFSPPTPLRAGTVFSFSEKMYASQYSQWASEMFNHNLRHFIRVYPFGLRFTSSNANPTGFWRNGVQLVALNWQKSDEGMMLNEGMFAGEGGYVLKPAYFRPMLDGGLPLGRLARKKLDLEIEVLAAQGIPLPDHDEDPASFEPYVKVELHIDDPAVEGEETKGRTKKAKNKGIDAKWEPRKKSRKLFSTSSTSDDHAIVLGEEGTGVQKKSKRIGDVVKFKAVEWVCDPSMSFVRIKIHDDEFGKDDLAAWACIRLDRLRRGWRCIKLFDRKGRVSEGVLLCRIGWRLN